MQNLSIGECDLSLSFSPCQPLQRLRQQLFAPTWDINGARQRVVEEKKTKERIGRNPDSSKGNGLR
jgi:hypothetical protein